uniref:TonB-dependent receptor n=1 Tax=Roseihalotalea indica TaxID=2867963 RepID=A0AA49JG23_9BACT|nr:TonB-dependent receptor [Tunicatimonas sp. TK19036]
MYKSVITFFILLTLSLSLQAQNSFEVRGKVVSLDERDILIGAVIKSESGKGTVANERGAFSIELTGGVQEITISYLGYEQKKVTVSEDKTDVGTITLPLSSTSLNEIIVSASARSFNEEFVGTNYRISPQEIEKSNPLSTEEILRMVPGVNIVGDMGLSNRPNISIRGSWGRRSKKVLLMEDGSPSAPAPYIAPGAYYNPVSDRIKAIEVYKGADMLRFGPNNMYGAVNYITALPPQKPELRLKLIGGQRNYTTGLFSYGGTWNNLGALVEGVYKSFDGFQDNSSVEVLNLNAKVFAQLNKNQSLYFKVSGQFEDNQASLASITPFTFAQDPLQNPFDADIFTMRRYGVDIIHKLIPRANMSLTSKIYASDFERDWWRQVTTKVRASEVRSYVGESIFQDRYSYLDGLDFGPEDYVRVGRVTDGHESTTDSRWAFTVSGLQETLNIRWDAWDSPQELEVGFKLHQEVYKDRLLMACNSRWARSGDPATDLYYHMWSASAYVRNKFQFNKLGIIPIFRFEHVDMYRQDVLALAQNTDLNGLEEGREPNIYNVFLPGLTLEYQLPKGAVFGSIYEGFIAPSKIFGFLVEQNGVVTNPFAGASINIQPELSVNTELGWRGSLLQDKVDAQLTYFNNTIRNFYAGGRNEVFDELGKVNVQGIEMSLGADLYRSPRHQLRMNGNLTLLKSTILQGKLLDRDLFSEVIHSTATRQEFIEKVNANRSAYELYTTNGTGNEALITDSKVNDQTLNQITKSVVKFGEDGVSEVDLPYSPDMNVTAGIDYNYQNFSLGLSGNYVGSQFTEFNNFVNESADGSIGRLPAFFTMDAYANYDFSVREKAHFSVFINGKNLTNQIYRASRLNRATSGIFPGGFRQFILGVNIRI